MCDFHHATILSSSFQGSSLGTPGTMTPNLCIKCEQKCENTLQIMSLAAHASETNKASGTMS